MDSTFNVPPVSTSLQQSEKAGGAEQQTMSVYLRVKPFSKEELSQDEDQNCVVIENSQMVTLNAPKGSATMKSSEKGIGLTVHKFSFSQVFGPETTQAELFNNTFRSQMLDFWDGKNALIFSYGVTNAGKTFTIQGTPEEPGILPRVLDATFHHIGDRQYERMDLKPYLRNDAQCLDPDQVNQERWAKAAIFASVKELDLLKMSLTDSLGVHHGPELSSCSGKSLSSSCLSYSQTVLSSSPTEAGSSQFALWAAFFEIYNECVYDLLQPSLGTRSKKRAALHVREDGAGNAYVKDLRWINIQTLDEACKLLQFGNKNRSAAATKMNHSSSRSHSIFTMKLLKTEGGAVKRVSEFSLCDLAGSERCNKTKTFGQRLKEAGNINNSLLILGKCITALHNNQNNRMKNSYIPFRESKLTKLFQAVLCGSGRASMIVNINQCASTYDETLHVMKFSAVAKEVVQVIPEKPLESLAPCLVGRDGKPLVSTRMLEEQALENVLSEDEPLDEDEANLYLLPQNELVNLFEKLQTKLLAERRRNMKQEMEIRKEMGDAMLQQLMESEELRRRQIEELKESHQEQLENIFEMYKDAIKDHAYQSAMDTLENQYVPLDEFLAEQQKVEVLRRKVLELETLSSNYRGESTVSTMGQSCHTPVSKATAAAAVDDLPKWLSKEKRAIERMCEDVQQVILCLEKKMMELSETLANVRNCFLEKSAELEALQGKSDDHQKKIGVQCVDSVSLNAELTRTSLKSFVVPKTKRGLLASIREAVTSPQKGSTGRPHRKTARTTHN